MATKVVGVRFTDEEIKDIQLLALRENRKVSNYIRNTILKEIRELKITNKFK